MSTMEQATERYQALVKQVREYHGSEQSNLAARLFAAMADMYRHELVLAEPADLRFRQAVARQMEKLQELFGEGHANSDPRI